MRVILDYRNNPTFSGACFVFFITAAIHLIKRRWCLRSPDLTRLFLYSLTSEFSIHWWLEDELPWNYDSTPSIIFVIRKALEWKANSTCYKFWVVHMNVHSERFLSNIITTEGSQRCRNCNLYQSWGDHFKENESVYVVLQSDNLNGAE